jgi:hypothetical protein
MECHGYIDGGNELGEEPAPVPFFHYNFHKEFCYLTLFE